MFIRSLSTYSPGLLLMLMLDFVSVAFYIEKKICTFCIGIYVVFPFLKELQKVLFPKYLCTFLAFLNILLIFWQMLHLYTVLVFYSLIWVVTLTTRMLSRAAVRAVARAQHFCPTR